MKTKLELIHDTVNTLTLEHIAKDLEKHTGYGDRFMKAAKIVLSDGVKDLGKGEYEVHSGTDTDIRYKVNGTCNCQDWKNWLKHEAWLKKPEGDDVKTFAPKGWCKHRIAAKFYAHTLAHLKGLVERFSLPHPHRWACQAHRHLPVDCWQAVCPDTADIVCPSCTHEDDVEKDRERAHSLATLEGDVPGEEVVITPEQQHAALEEACQVVRDAQVAEALADQEEAAVVTEPTDVAELPPLVLQPEQYEEAPVLMPQTPAMPEAPVSFYIKFKVKNFELSYTMRAPTDREVIERLPGVLAGLEDVLKIEVDHEEHFLTRLLHAFFPKPSRYTGK